MRTLDTALEELGEMDSRLKIVRVLSMCVQYAMRLECAVEHEGNDPEALHMLMLYIFSYEILWSLSPDKRDIPRYLTSLAVICIASFKPTLEMGDVVALFKNPRRTINDDEVLEEALVLCADFFRSQWKQEIRDFEKDTVKTLLQYWDQKLEDYPPRKVFDNLQEMDKLHEHKGTKH